jgi:hypothetical protein
VGIVLTPPTDAPCSSKQQKAAAPFVPKSKPPKKRWKSATIAALDTAERAELHRLLEKIAAHLSLQNATCP